MSDQKPNQPAPNLSNAEKDTARRLGMSAGEYSSAKQELVKRGKIRG